MIVDNLTICEVPDHIGQGQLCRLPDGHVRYSILDAMPGMDASAWQACVAKAFRAWADVADVSGMEEAAAAHADLLLSVRMIDGPGSVLAWCEMACGQQIQHPYQLKARVDAGEYRWIDRADPGPNEIDLLAVLTHEFGHFFGLSHDENESSLMFFQYRRGIRTPQPRDIQRMVARYGPPKALPAPIPVPVPVPVPTPPVPNLGGFMAKIALIFMQAALTALISRIRATPSVDDDRWLPALEWIQDILTAFSAGAAPPTVGQLASAKSVLGLPI